MNMPESLPLAPRSGWGMARNPATHPETLAQPQRMPLSRPTVRAVLREWGPWVCCMALLGMCEDGIPLAARFFDPQRTSHYLFYGQDDAVLALLVEPLLYSTTVQGYGPEHWQFVILSEETTEWDVAESPHCQGVISPYERAGDELIPAMAGIMEQRSFGRHRGPRYLVVLHDIGRYWKQMSEDTHYDIVPLLKRGHEFGIHVIATLRYEHYPLVPKAVRQLLRHKIYGYAASAHLPNTAAFREMTSLLSYDLLPHQAWVRADGEWLRYTAPRLG